MIPFEIIIQLLKAAFHYYVILACDFNIGNIDEQPETATTTTTQVAKKKKKKTKKAAKSGKMMSFYR